MAGEVLLVFRTRGLLIRGRQKAVGQHGAIRISMAPSSSTLFSFMVLTPGWRSVLLGRVDGAPADLCEGAVPVMFCTGG